MRLRERSPIPLNSSDETYIKGCDFTLIPIYVALAE